MNRMNVLSRKSRFIIVIIIFMIAIGSLFLWMAMQKSQYKLVAQWKPQGSYIPYQLAIDHKGDVYINVTVNFQHFVQKFTNNGRFLAHWQSRPYVSPSISCDPTTGIAVDSYGSVYISDQYGCRMRKFTNDGHLTTVFAPKLGEPGRLSCPCGVEVDEQGNIYVAAMSRNQVVELGRNGVFKVSWGSTGKSDGQFNGPYSIALGPDNSIYVSDSGNNRIQKFSRDGKFIIKWTIPNDSRGIVADVNGNVYVCDRGNNQIIKYSSSGNIIANIQVPKPESVAVDASGHVFVTSVIWDYNTNWIDKILNPRNTKIYFIRRLLGRTNTSATEVEGSIYKYKPI